MTFTKYVDWNTRNNQNLRCINKIIIIIILNSIVGRGKEGLELRQLVYCNFFFFFFGYKVYCNFVSLCVKKTKIMVNLHSHL